MDWRAEGVHRQGQIQPGHISLFPAHLAYSMHSPHVGDYLTVRSSSPSWPARTAELGGLEQIELRPVCGEDDPLVREILQGFKAELEQRTAGGTLYAESLATALAVHLVRKYAVRVPRFERVSRRAGQAAVAADAGVHPQPVGGQPFIARNRGGGGAESVSFCAAVSTGHRLRPPRLPEPLPGRAGQAVAAAARFQHRRGPPPKLGSATKATSPGFFKRHLGTTPAAFAAGRRARV